MRSGLSETYCDACLVAGDQRFPAHKVILAAASPPLDAYFRNAQLCDPCQPIELGLDGIEEPLALDVALAHMYEPSPEPLTGLAPGVLQQVLLCARAFDLPSLARRVPCGRKLRRPITMPGSASEQTFPTWESSATCLSEAGEKRTVDGPKCVGQRVMSNIGEPSGPRCDT